MSERLHPFLMFQGQAEAAMNLYVSVLPDSEILELVRYAPEGAVMRARCRLAGQEVWFSDSAVEHAFTFTPSMSLFVDCASDEEIERLAAALGEGGTVLMALANYGFSRRFTWLNDHFGVSWQLNLA